MAGPAFRLAQSAYHSVLMLRNRLFNLFDSPVIVLTYHRVAALEPDPQLLAVKADYFRAHMQFLKNNFHVARFEDDWSNVGKPAVAVTFDDGYADNVLAALPILEEVEVPATFFVTTGTIGTRQEFWWDELERIILGNRVLPESFKLDDDGFRLVWPTVTSIQRLLFYQEIHPLMKKVDPARRERWILRLRQWAQAGEEGREMNRPMSVDELRRLSESKWATIGAHAVTHTPLSSISEAAQEEELTASKRTLEAWTGKKVEVFSYPFGSKYDYTKQSAALCRKAGFSKAASGIPGQAHRWTDQYQIPRQLVRNWEIDTFASRVKDFWIR